jgi:hypothetical protein
MAQRSSSPRSLFSPEAELHDDMASESESPVQDASADQSNRSRSDEPERTFHPFPRLPTELRLKIWEMTVEPRVVELRCEHKSGSIVPDDSRHIRLSSPTPPPATLAACRESRDHLFPIYAQVPLKNGGWKCVSPPMRKRTPKWLVTNDTTQEYVFLSWDNDTVSIGTQPLDCFESIALSVKTLQLERKPGNEYWDRWESQKLLDFKNVETVHVMAAPGQDVEWWHGTSEDIPWPCGPENVFITDEQRTMRLTDVEDMCDREWERKERERDSTTTVKFRNGTAYEERNGKS